MFFKKSWLVVGALALVGVLVIAGCGGGGSSSSSPSTQSSGTETEAATTTSNEGATTEEAAPEGEEPSPAAEGGEAATAKAGGAAAGGGAVVKASATDELGKVIVDAEGMTMYDFHKDKGGKSACYGGCAAAWPPFLTEGTPKAMEGAQPSLIGTTKRKDGTEQVTYNGHPLYGYVGDTKPGETTGNDISQFGAEWYALKPSGEEPDDDD